MLVPEYTTFVRPSAVWVHQALKSTIMNLYQHDDQNIPHMQVRIGNEALIIKFSIKMGGFEKSCKEKIQLFTA